MCDCDFLPHYFYLGHLCVKDTFCCGKVCKLPVYGFSELVCVCKSVAEAVKSHSFKVNLQLLVKVC